MEIDQDLSMDWNKAKEVPRKTETNPVKVSAPCKYFRERTLRIWALFNIQTDQTIYLRVLNMLKKCKNSKIKLNNKNI